MPTAPDESVVVVRQSFGYNARLATALFALVIVAVLAILLIHHRNATVQQTASTLAPDTLHQATGEVALGAQPDTSMMSAGGTVVPTPVPVPMDTMPQQAPPGAYPTTPYPATPYPATTYPVAPPPAGSTYPDSMARMTPPTSRRSEPPRQIPPTVAMPSPTTATPPVDTSTPPAATPSSPDGGVCASPASDEQHACLMEAIEQNDLVLNQTYNQLIGAMRQRANALPGDPDPASVRDLRAAESVWVESRDAACRDVGAPPLYAQARAQCFADWSNKRTQTLRQMLGSLR